MKADKSKSLKKKICTFLASYWILIWLFIACLGLASVITYAAYTHSNYTKRVVTINGGGGLQFSSDNLRTVSESESLDTESRPRYVYYTENTDPEIAFNVCNYPQNSAASINPLSITYTLSATVYGKSGSTQLTSVDDLSAFVGDGEDFNENSCYIKYNGEIYSLISEDSLGLEISDLTLTAAESTTHSFTLHMDSRLAKNVDIFISAVPNEESKAAAASQILCRRFVFTQSAEQTTSWIGEFTDVISEDYEYYGYNYRLSGTKQEERVLVWDTEKIQLSKLSLAKLGKQDSDITYDTENHTASLTLQLGEADEGEEIVTSYDLQFYRTSTNTSTEPPDSSWAELKESQSEEESET